MAYHDTCKAGGEPVQMSLYSVLDHVQMAGASAPEWLAWIADRFSGKEAASACDLVKRDPFDGANA